MPISVKISKMNGESFIIDDIPDNSKLQCLINLINQRVSNEDQNDSLFIAGTTNKLSKKNNELSTFGIINNTTLFMLPSDYKILKSILPPDPELIGNKLKKRNIQYQHLINCAEIITNWIKDNNDSLEKKSIFFSEEYQLPNNITINNCVKTAEIHMDGVGHSSDFASFRYTISDEYGYLDFMGTFQNGIYVFNRFFWKHKKYWDPME